MAVKYNLEQYFVKIYLELMVNLTFFLKIKYKYNNLEFIFVIVCVNVIVSLIELRVKFTIAGIEVFNEGISGNNF
jgi:hypothetical protein